MLSKKVSEIDLRGMFCRFGLIEECSILRGGDTSRGCGFVTFSSKAAALNAIRAMHHSTTMEVGKGLRVYSCSKCHIASKVHMLQIVYYRAAPPLWL